MVKEKSPERHHEPDTWSCLWIVTSCCLSSKYNTEEDGALVVGRSSGQASSARVYVTHSQMLCSSCTALTIKLSQSLSGILNFLYQSLSTAVGTYPSGNHVGSYLINCLTQKSHIAGFFYNCPQDLLATKLMGWLYYTYSSSHEASNSCVSWEVYSWQLTASSWLTTVLSTE